MGSGSGSILTTSGPERSGPLPRLNRGMTMRASKENAATALTKLKKMVPGPDDCSDFVEEFIKAAGRKLPSEAAYDRERNRKRELPPKKRKPA